MVGETFNDTRFAAAQRQAAQQAAQKQQIAAQNVNQARADAERRSQRGSFTMTPTQSGMQIGRQNQIGYSAPTVSFRGLTPNGSSLVRQAMSPSPVFQPNVVVQNNQASTSKVDERKFLLGR
jgi:hypothetical protein